MLANHDQRPKMKKYMEEIGTSAGVVERGVEKTGPTS